MPALSCLGYLRTWMKRSAASRQCRNSGRRSSFARATWASNHTSCRAYGQVRRCELRRCFAKLMTKAECVLDRRRYVCQENFGCQ